METRTNFEQAAQPPANPHTAGRRADHTRKNLQQRGFAGTVPTDDGNAFALFHLEVNVAQCPEDFFCLDFNAGRSVTLPATTQHGTQTGTDRIAQRFLRRRLGLRGAMLEQIALRKIFYNYCFAHDLHQIGEAAFSTPEEPDARDEKHDRDADGNCEGFPVQRILSA
ncbi:hypothetical protein D3C87_1606640 [compost metagenome]